MVYTVFTLWPCIHQYPNKIEYIGILHVSKIVATRGKMI